MGAQVFISYSRKDSDVVRALSEALERAGYPVWVDTGAISAGDVWRSEIVSGIRSCSAFVLLISPQSAASRNVVKELSIADGEAKRIFPVLVGDARIPPEMEYQLAGLQHVALDTEDPENAARRLVVALGAAGLEPLVPADDAAPAVSPDTLGVEPSRARSRRPIWLGSALAVLLAVLVATVLWLVRDRGDGPRNDEPAPVVLDPLQPPQTLRIAVGDFAAHMTFRDDEFRASLKANAGVVLEVVSAQSVAPSDPPDLRIRSLCEFVSGPANGRIVALVNVSAGADAVMLDSVNHPELKSLDKLDELVGEWAKRGGANGAPRKPGIALVPATPGMFLALALDLDENEFHLDDYAVRTVASSEEALRLLDDPAEQVVLATLWEPWITCAKRKGHSTAITSAEIPETIVGVLVATDAALASKSAAVERLVVAYYDEVDNLRLSDGRRQARFRAAGLDREEARSVSGTVALFTARHAASWLREGTLSARIAYVTEILRRSRAHIRRITGARFELPPPGREWVAPEFIERADRLSRAYIARLETTDPGQAARLNEPLTPGR